MLSLLLSWAMVQAGEPAPARKDCVVGAATLRKDRVLMLHMRAEGPGGLIGDAMFLIAPDDSRYQGYLRHIGGLEVGQSKPVPCWPSPAPMPGGRGEPASQPASAPV
ncbi:MAG: hypothetical protein U1E77_10265 [Inhella sp.]